MYQLIGNYSLSYVSFYIHIFMYVMSAAPKQCQIVRRPTELHHLQFLLSTNVALVQNFMSVLGVMESKEIPTQVAYIGPEGNHNANSKIFAFISRL